MAILDGEGELGQQPAGEVGLLAVQASLRKLAKCWRKACRTGFRPRTVHQLRIAVRRAGATLAVFEEGLPPSSVRKMRKTLSGIRREVALLRDLDVFLEQHPRGGKWRRVLKRRRRRRYQDLIERQTDRDVSRRLRKWRKRVPLIWRSEKVGAGQSFSEFARQKWSAISGDFLQWTEEPPSSAAALHRFRITVKKLRYRWEVLRPGLSAKWDSEVREGLKQLQLILGAINDSAMARELIDDAHRKGKHAADADREAEQQKLNRLKKEFRNYWNSPAFGSLCKSLRRQTH